MMPIHPDTWISYTFAILSGFGFGFVLERAGFGSSKKLAAQFYLRDMTVLKVMFTAIVTAMLGIVLLRAAGVLDFDALYVNPTSMGPQVVGGLIFGAGFVVGGYCPGTSIVAAVTGKLDAVVFLAGAGAGVLVFAGAYDKIGAFATSGANQRILLTDWLHLSFGVVALLVTLLALGMFVGAEWIERRMRRSPATPPPAAAPVDGTTATSAE
jgi:uncharacterized membrane protein YedE/YeeE